MGSGDKPSTGPVRGECQVQFRNIEDALTSVGTAMTNLTKEVVDQGKKHAEAWGEQKALNRLVREQLRDEIKPALTRAAGEAGEQIAGHEGSCLARKKFEKDVIAPRYYAARPRRPILSPTMIRRLLYIGLTIGGIFAGFAGSRGIVDADEKPASVETPQPKP